MPSQMVEATYICFNCRKDIRMKFEPGYRPFQRMLAPCPYCRKLAARKLVKIKGLRLTTWPGKVR